MVDCILLQHFIYIILAIPVKLMFLLIGMTVKILRSKVIIILHISGVFPLTVCPLVLGMIQVEQMMV